MNWEMLAALGQLTGSLSESLLSFISLSKSEIRAKKADARPPMCLYCTGAISADRFPITLISPPSTFAGFSRLTILIPSKN
jgi:hypothetical protein